MAPISLRSAGHFPVFFESHRTLPLPVRVAPRDDRTAQRTEGKRPVQDFALFWEWLSFAVRWLHVITAIAWIGSSFYFVALDLGLKQRPNLPVGAYGEEWQVHGGGFYHVQKYWSRRPNCPNTSPGSSGRATPHGSRDSPCSASSTMPVRISSSSIAACWTYRHRLRS